MKKLLLITVIALTGCFTGPETETCDQGMMSVYSFNVQPDAGQTIDDFELNKGSTIYFTTKEDCNRHKELDSRPSSCSVTTQLGCTNFSVRSE